MPILDKNNKEQIKKYEEFIRSQERTSALQDLNWAKVKKGWDFEAVYIEKNESIIAAASYLIRKFLGKYTIIYAPRGPICDIYDVSLVNDLINESLPLVKKYNAYVIKFDPEIVEDEKLVSMYKNSGYKVRTAKSDKDELIQPIHNMILNIEKKTIDEIFKSYSEKTRYNIRVAMKKEIEITYSTSKEDLKTFFELSEITIKRDKISGRRYDYYERLLDSFNEDDIRIYLAKHANEALSGAILIKYGQKAFYIYGASSNEKRNYMPNYLLQHEMIKYAVESNLKEYDFGGVYNLNKEDGLYKFKEGFCRQDKVTTFIGEIDKVFNKKVYFVYAKILPLYKKTRSIVKKIIYLFTK